MNYKVSIAAVACAMIMASCGEPQFKIEGEIDGAEGKTLVLEKGDFHGYWVALDSVKIGKSGKFSIKGEAPASPDIYRLSLGNKFIYLPVDSIETLNLTSSASHYGSEFTLSGTPQAERLASFEKELMALGNPADSVLAKFKRDVYTKYIKDGEGSIVSYYVLTKVRDNKPLYDPADKEDAKYYAAVATQFEQYRPNDPHGKMVKEVSLEAMKNRNSALGKKTVISAEELKVIEVALPDEKGVIRKLSDMVGKGKKTVVIFGLMNAEESPVFNRQLASIYEANKGNVDFYHISLDSGQYEWREAARNLPWTTVIDPNGTASTALVDYNVGTLPAVFIYSTSGELTDRPESLDELRKKL